MSIDRTVDLENPAYIGKVERNEGYERLMAEKKRKSKIFKELTDGAIQHQTADYAFGQERTYFRLYENVSYFTTSKIITVEEVADYAPEITHTDTDLTKPDLLIGIEKCHYVLAHVLVLLESDTLKQRIQRSMQRTNKIPGQKFTLTPIDCADIVKETDRQTFLNTLTFMYTGYLKVDAFNLKHINSLAHRLQCNTLSHFLQFQHYYSIDSNDETYHQDMERLNSLTLKPKLVMFKTKPKRSNTLHRVTTPPMSKKELQNVLDQATQFLQA